MSEELESKFVSAKVESFAEQHGLSAEHIEELGIEATGKEDKFTKADVQKAIELCKDDELEEANKVAEGEVFTYVGGGEDSPRVINFMGMQQFVRGRATAVTNPVVLSKIRNNPTFVEGEVDEEELYAYDEKAKAEADAQRAEDRVVEAAFRKKHG